MSMIVSGMKILLVCFGIISWTMAQLSFKGRDTTATPPQKIRKANDTLNVDARLGLLASSLGLDPIPGGGVDGVKKGLYDTKDRYNLGGGVYQGDGGSYGNNNNGNNNGYYPPISPPANGAKCECVPKQYCSGRPGSIASGGDYGKGNGNNGEYIDSGLLPGQGTNPEVDGTGNIDIRIVNRPPPGVVCGYDQIYCCDSGLDGPGSGSNGPNPTSHTCGISTIINVPGYRNTYGQADFGEYPWFAVILSSSNNYLGAGALLDDYHVLTAAHKVKDYRPGNPMKVRFGEWNAQDDSEPFKNIEIEVARIDFHPNFNAENLQNDVAIIKLSQPIDIYTYPHIKSVCLPKQNSDFVGKRCWVPGFGKDAFKVGKHSYYLREVDVPVVESGECEARLRQTRLGGYFQLNRRSFLCAGGEDGKDACTGDGGSPLVCKGYDGRFQVVGLVAWGIGCADYGIPGVYVNIPSYSAWIEQKLAY